MKTLSCLPYRVSGIVLPCNPCLACGIQQVLRSEDIYRQEQLRVLNTPVYMAFCGKVYDIVDVVFGKQSVSEFSVPYVSADEEATLVVDVVFNCAEVSGVGQKVEHNDFDVLIFVLSVKQVLDEVRTNESCGSCYKISLHVYILFLMIFPFASVYSVWLCPWRQVAWTSVCICGFSFIASVRKHARGTHLRMNACV